MYCSCLLLIVLSCLTTAHPTVGTQTAMPAAVSRRRKPIPPPLPPVPVSPEEIFLEDCENNQSEDTPPQLTEDKANPTSVRLNKLTDKDAVPINDNILYFKLKSKKPDDKENEGADTSSTRKTTHRPQSFRQILPEIDVPSITLCTLSKLRHHLSKYVYDQKADLTNRSAVLNKIIERTPLAKIRVLDMRYLPYCRDQITYTPMQLYPSYLHSVTPKIAKNDLVIVVGEVDSLAAEAVLDGISVFLTEVLFPEVRDRKSCCMSTLGLAAASHMADVIYKNTFKELSGEVLEVAEVLSKKPLRLNEAHVDWMVEGLTYLLSMPESMKNECDLSSLLWWVQNLRKIQVLTRYHLTQIFLAACFNQENMLGAFEYLGIADMELVLLILNDYYVKSQKLSFSVQVGDRMLRLAYKPVKCPRLDNITKTRLAVNGIGAKGQPYVCSCCSDSRNQNLTKLTEKTVNQRFNYYVKDGTDLPTGQPLKQDTQTMAAQSSNSQANPPLERSPALSEDIPVHANTIVVHKCALLPMIPAEGMYWHSLYSKVPPAPKYWFSFLRMMRDYVRFPVVHERVFLARNTLYHNENKFLKVHYKAEMENGWEKAPSSADMPSADLFERLFSCAPAFPESCIRIVNGSGTVPFKKRRFTSMLDRFFSTFFYDKLWACPPYFQYCNLRIVNEMCEIPNFVQIAFNLKRSQINMKKFSRMCAYDLHSLYSEHREFAAALKKAMGDNYDASYEDLF